MFLRGNEYDPVAAADQMLRFFDLKLELFGEEKLTTEITMTDLDDGDIISLTSGWLQVAGRDRAGRQVTISVGWWYHGRHS